MTDALAINDYREPQYHGRKSKPWDNVIPANLARAKVAREPKPPPAPVARIEVAPIVQPSIANPHPPVVGRAIKNYDDVIDAFRDRADDLEISRHEIDRLTGLADAHASMLLTKSCMKVFGPQSLPLMLQVLGLRFRIEEDPEQTALTLRRRERRMRSHAHYSPQFPPISGRVKGWLFGYPAPIAGKPKR
jgi:hypothetical protein